MTLSTGSEFSITENNKELRLTLDSGTIDVPLYLEDTKMYYTASHPSTIRGWYINGDVSGSLVLDIWKKQAGIPTNTDSICGTEKPTLTAQQQNSDTKLDTWTTNIEIGDTLGFEVESVVDITRAVLTIKLA